MTHTSIDTLDRAPLTSGPVAPGRVTFAGVVRSEFTKLRSVRSTAWALLTAVALVVVPGILTCMLRVAHWSESDASTHDGFDAVAVSITGIFLAQFAVGVLGVLVMTNEYATGSIRTTFAAVPRRLPVLGAKVVAVASTVIGLGLPAVVATFFAGQSVLAAKGLDVGLGQPGVARALAGSVLYLVVITMLGLGLGALSRNTTAGVVLLVGMVFVLPVIASFLPGDVANDINKFLPMAAGGAITSATPIDPVVSLPPWPGFGVFCTYAIAALGLGAWRLRRRDA
jgi:ABC-2 type transport system permease protein